MDGWMDGKTHIVYVCESAGTMWLLSRIDTSIVLVISIRFSSEMCFHKVESFPFQKIQRNILTSCSIRNPGLFDYLTQGRPGDVVMWPVV